MSSPLSATDDESSARYFGWRVVVACFLMALACWGFGLYGHSVYLAELTRLHGWPPSLISGASTATYLLNAVLVIFTSNALARFGARRFVLFGVAALGVALVLLATAREPWQIYAAYLAMSFGWLGLGLVTIPTLISQWFTRKRGLAISLALNGASFGGIVVAPLLVVLIGVTGFQSAMLIAAAVMVVILVPVVILWVPSQAATPAPAQSAEPLWTRRDALRSLPFWTVSGPFALALLAQVAFIVHQIAFMEPLVGPRAGRAVGLADDGVRGDRPPHARHGGRPARSALDLVRLDVQPGGRAVLHDADARPDAAADLLRGLWLLGRQHHHAALADHAARVPAGLVQPGAGLSTAIGTFAGALGPGLIGLIRAAAGDYGAALLVCMALKIVGGAFVLIRKR